MTDVLTAIDDALDTGVATDDDPLTRELQELALALRADAPEPTDRFSEWLDRRVEEGFPKSGPARPPLWRQLLHPAPAIAVVFLIALPLALTWSPSRSSDDDDGGGGGAAMSDGGSGGGSVAREAAPVPDQAAGGAEPAMVLPPADRGFAPGRSNRKIERTIGLELEMPVDDMPRVAEQVTAVTNRHGGVVLSASLSTRGGGGGGGLSPRGPPPPRPPPPP